MHAPGAPGRISAGEPCPSAATTRLAAVRPVTQARSCWVAARAACCFCGENSFLKQCWFQPAPWLIPSPPPCCCHCCWSPWDACLRETVCPMVQPLDVVTRNEEVGERRGLEARAKGGAWGVGGR